MNTSSCKISGIRNLIFDFGGVLVQWDPRQVYLKYFSNDLQAVEHFLAEIHFSDWNLLQDAGRSFAEAVDLLSRQFPQYSELIRAYDREWEQSITGILPGTVEIVKKLKRAGYFLFGLSNWSAEKFPIIRSRYPFFHLFEDIVISGEVKMIKPDPVIFQLLLDRNHLSPETCLLIDDSPGNIDTARQLGIQTIFFTTSEQLSSELEGRGILADSQKQA